ncbi:MAG TPA: tRNA cytidylyltransferase [Anaeromyxobacteraceae bacterium]|nr:tRNA cytidylyltransferase [Anaeromyxobacteraceae bacterium]
MPSRLPAALARATIPEPVLEVLRTLDAAGHRSWLVGGAVRDVLLGRRRDGLDFDLATPATPDEVTRLFPRVIPTGIEHGTVTVLVGKEKVEVTTFRGEGAYVDGRRPESVTFHRDLEADLARRDFTINALAFDPVGADFRDPFGGRADLRARTIRAVGDPDARFGEDGLRPMRAVRFAAQLGFSVHPRTRSAIPRALDVVRRVSAERIADELAKLLVAPHAEEGLHLLRRTGLLEAVIPAVAALAPRALDHVVRVAPRAPARLEARLAALLHRTRPDDARAIALDLRFARRVADEVSALVAAHACVLDGAAPAPEEPAHVRRWLARVGPARADAVLALRDAEVLAAPPSRRERLRAAAGALRARVATVTAQRPPLATGDLAMDGAAVMRFLDLPPGPAVGEALRHLLDRVLEDPALNDRGALSVELSRWWEARVLSLKAGNAGNEADRGGGKTEGSRGR